MSACDCSYIVVVLNRPKGSREHAKLRYDANGKLTTYTDKMYAIDVETDPAQQACPYRSLYRYERRFVGQLLFCTQTAHLCRGFELQFSQYKVFSVIIKLLLAATNIWFWRSITHQASLTIVILGLVVIFSSTTRPYLDPSVCTPPIHVEVCVVDIASIIAGGYAGGVRPHL
jgi:hypothetical protein